MHVLLVDDHPDLLDLVARALTRDDHVVTCAGTLARGRDEIRARKHDLIVLDVALPDGTGIDLCRELRRSQVTTPILLLTAHGEVAQRVAGLDAGADDFLAKPFAMAELRARVRALLRRGPLPRSSVLLLGDVALDFASRRASRQSLEVPLTAREWSLLELLASRSQRVVSRSEILETIWGEQSESASASLDVIATRVRRKLGAELLRTVRSHGYALGTGART
jgi:DNA-binding response OmpR family regulator